jgi:hypothetical protein
MKARLGWMAAVGVAGLLLVACLPVSGGGYIQSAGSSTGKANFSFQVTCSNGYNTGPWNYKDNTPGPGSWPAGTKLNIAGDMSSGGNPCSGNPGVQTYVSTYTVQGNCSVNCTGTAFISIFDSGARGSMKGDCLSIALDYGPFDGYRNSDPSRTQCSGSPGSSLKPVLGGNLKVG